MKIENYDTLLEECNILEDKVRKLNQVKTEARRIINRINDCERDIKAFSESKTVRIFISSYHGSENGFYMTMETMEERQWLLDYLNKTRDKLISELGKLTYEP